MPRDINGNFTLAPGNPVTPGTVIEAAWANPTLSDIALNLTDSLSRTGQGGMLVPFRNIDGTVAAPGMTWSNEPSSGWYRAGLNDFWYSVSNTNIFRITAAGVELAPGKTFIGLGPLSLTSLTIASGSLVASAPALNVTQTWNNAAVQFIGADMNITDTASHASSILERWRVNGVDKASILKDGSFNSALNYLSSATTFYIAGTSGVVGAINIGSISAASPVNILVNNSSIFSVNAGSTIVNIGEFQVTGGTITTGSATALSFATSGGIQHKVTNIAGTTEWIGTRGGNGASRPSIFADGAAATVPMVLGNKGAGSFEFYNDLNVSPVNIASLSKGLFAMVNNAQLLIRLQKTDTGQVWRLQTDVSVIDDFGIFNQNLGQGVLRFGPAGGAMFTPLNFSLGGQMLSSGGVGPPGAPGYGAFGATSGGGAAILGHGTTYDIVLFNQSGVVAAYVPPGTSNFFINGLLAKGSGSFDILHPLNPLQRLRHSFIEGPRYDLIYRGNTNVVGGVANVNLDTDIGGTGMMAGTFVALTRNPSVWLNRGNLTFTLLGSALSITGPDGPVSWLVIAERNDAHITTGHDWNDASGNMILEYTPPPEVVLARSGAPVATAFRANLPPPTGF